MENKSIKIDYAASENNSNQSHDATETKNSSISTPSAPPDDTTVVQPLTKTRVFQNFFLIWLDLNVDESNDDYCSLLAQLRRVINTIIIFNDINRCIQFLTKTIDEKAFMIVSDCIGQYVVSQIHQMSQLDSVYVFCSNRLVREQWTKDWSKVKGVFTDVVPICELLKKAVRQFDYASVPISFGQSSYVKDQKLNQLDQSFMYTQMLKEILFEINYSKDCVSDFTAYCREQCVNQSSAAHFLDNFETEYYLKGPAWWYTYPGFIFSMLNRALRNQEVDTIIKMGFFVRDLHEQIKELHKEQFIFEQVADDECILFTVYRGQGMTPADFSKMLETKGGLLSFNNFLSTSQDRAVCSALAESNADDPNLIGVVFEINIDTSIETAPFANLGGVSYFRSQESEILFSMHTVFRICEIEQINNEARVWIVKLTLTKDNDPQLSALTERIREETEGVTGWHRLGELLIRLARHDKAEEIYMTLLNVESVEYDKAYLYHQLGQIKNHQGNYAAAISFHGKAIRLRQNTLSPNNPDMAFAYSKLGEVFEKMGECTQALFCYDRAHYVYQRILSPDDLNLAASFNKIASVHSSLANYSKALSFYTKALEIQEKRLPSIHPFLSVTYNNIGYVYRNMGDYSKGIYFYERARHIDEKSLPPNHPELAASYSNIGTVYYALGNYSKALSFHEQANEIYTKSLSSNHPNLAMSYSNIGSVYEKMGNHSQALLFHEKALHIYQATLPQTHELLAICNNNIGSVYQSLGDYAKALSFYETELEIEKISLSPSHPSLAISYNNIGSAYYHMGDYSKALLYHEKAYEIFQETLASDHPDLATFHNSMGVIYEKLEDATKSLYHHEKALEIRNKTFPPNHPSIATCYNNIATVYDNMGKYFQALSFYEKVLEIHQTSLSSNDLILASSYDNIGQVHNKIGNHSNALSYWERALELAKCSLPTDHPDLQRYEKNVAYARKQVINNSASSE
ncbi:unnamed protein product [Rotaria magnacalcarata]|uniref:Uncharacterized protein n=1 Tax=Rotaria magnacalcarata TaxID=392030 RepID=A0A816QNR4_9BILA|nr:unnamed protein product [Rotaria magnacalcarata]CAF3854551.1 unnamed protein product [Rotaria magnacalcarata]